MRNKSKNAGTVPRKQQKCTASQWSEEKLNEEKIIYVLCILGVLLVLLGLKKRNDTMYSSGVYHLNRSGTVESIENNNIVVRLDKLNEQDEDF